MSSLLQALLICWLWQGCDAAQNIFERAREGFEEATAAPANPDRETVERYMQQFRRVAELCPGHGDGWYYAHLAARIIKDPRADFFLRQAKLHNSSLVTKAQQPQRSGLELSASFIEEKPDGILLEGETVKMNASVKNTGGGLLSGVRLTLTGPPAVLDELGAERFLGDIPAGETRSIEMSGKIPRELVQEAGTIKVAASDASGVRRDGPVFNITLRPLSDINVPPPARTPDPDAFGIVVGIGRYRESQIPAIDYAKNDAEIVSEYFRSVAGVQPANIRKLLDETATKTDMEVTFREWLPQRVSPRSRVYVYFAGHGTPFLGANDTPEQYLVPFDARPESILSFFRLKDMYQALENLNVASTTVFLDTCFSGSGRSFTLPNTRPFILQGPVETEKVVVFSASEANQPSHDFPRVRHGLFTYFVLRGLRGEADVNRDRAVTVEEMFSFLSNTVSQTAIRVSNRPQKPTLMPALERLGGRAKTAIGTIGAK